MIQIGVAREDIRVELMYAKDLLIFNIQDQRKLVWVVTGADSH